MVKKEYNVKPVTHKLGDTYGETITINKPGEDQIVIDMTPIRNMRNDLEKELLSSGEMTGKESKVILEAMELYDNLDKNQQRQYNSELIGLLKKISYAYKGIYTDPEGLIQIKKDYALLFPDGIEKTIRKQNELLEQMELHDESLEQNEVNKEIIELTKTKENYLDLNAWIEQYQN